MSKLTSLSELQNLMQKAVQQNVAPAALLNAVLEKPPISEGQRLKIYQDAYQIRLLESLRDDFSRLQSVVGKEQFDEYALGYIKGRPSRFRNLAEYSEGFPKYIQKVCPEVLKVTLTDWLEILSANAGQSQNSMSAEEIQAGKIFKVKILQSTFFERVQDSFIVVYRNQDDVHTLDIDELSFRLLQFLQDDRSLEELTVFAEANRPLDEVIARTLRDWIGNRIIYAHSLAEEVE